MTTPDPFIRALEPEDAVAFDTPVPPDLMVRLDLDEIEGALGRFEADPAPLAAHLPRLADLSRRMLLVAAGAFAALDAGRRGGP